MCPGRRRSSIQVRNFSSSNCKGARKCRDISSSASRYPSRREACDCLYKFVRERAASLNALLIGSDDGGGWDGLVFVVGFEGVYTFALVNFGGGSVVESEDMSISLSLSRSVVGVCLV